MPSSRIQKHFGILEYLKDLSKKDQKNFIENASSEVLKTISEICLNLIKGTVKIPESDLKKLKKYKIQIVSLSQKRHSVKKRKNICNQKGGFLGSLLGVILPSLISTIITATQRKRS